MHYACVSVCREREREGEIEREWETWSISPPNYTARELSRTLVQDSSSEHMGACITLKKAENKITKEKKKMNSEGGVHQIYFFLTFPNFSAQ